ncbi:MAG TPA: hypothetical protein PK176_10755 [Acidobacteriota bacterium]|nr:hypothetical protein [Acidobacteriota bacterium]HQM63782.1 hypothetical protein [Acidobacteriota bacterium]
MPQQVLIHVHGNLPDAERPTVGNGLRAHQLGAALAERGVAVRYVTHSSFYRGVPPPDTMSLFDTSAEFQAILKIHRPELLILIQGEGLEMIPEAGCETPILADWIAPRMLEFAFQRLPLEQWLFRVLAAMNKADYHACCTEPQRAYLYAMLQLAGVEMNRASVAVVPLAAAGQAVAHSPSTGPDPVFVAGGVHWPWIRSARFLRILLEEMEAAGRGVLKLFGGRYPFAIDADQYHNAVESLPSSPRLQSSGLLPYPDLLREYAAADVAVDLFEENPERQLALSFREIDYLRCGLPMVCAPFAYIARYVGQYGAGWVLPDTDDQTIRRVFREILNLPRPLPAGYAEAASRLSCEVFDYRTAIQPILKLLSGPLRKAPPAASLLRASLNWSDQARLEMERLQRETRALRDELAAREHDLNTLRELEQEKMRHLSESSATIAELRRYIADKESNLQQSVNLIAEKDQALGYQQATIARLEEHARQLQDESARLREHATRLQEQLDAETIRLQTECDRLRQQVTGLEETLQTIQSKFLYRVFRKFTGK